MTTLPQTFPARTPRTNGNGNGSHLAMPGGNGSLGPGAVAPQAITPADVLRVIRSNLWFIAIVLIVSGVGGYALNMYLAARHSRYTSTGLITVRSRGDDALLDAHSSMDAGGLEVEQMTQVKLLLHDALLAKVLEISDKVRDTEWFKQFISYRNGEKFVDAEGAKADLYEHLEVRAEPNTRLIAVKMNWRIPKDCQTIVTEIVDQHIKEVTSHNTAQDMEHNAQLENLKQNYESQIRDDTNRIIAISTALGKLGVNVGPGQSAKDLELSQLISELLRAEAFLGAAEAKLRTFLTQLDSNSAPELQEALDKSQLYTDYRRRVEDEDAIYAETARELGERHRRSQEIKARSDKDRQKLADIENDIRSRTAEVYTANLKNDVEAATAATKRINVRLEDVRREISEIARMRNDYDRLQADLVVLRGQIDRVREKQDQSTFLRGKWAQVAWSTLPDLPDHPTFPRLWITLSMTMLAGLALSLGVAFLREITDTTVRTPRDIARVGQLTLLGMIPHEDDDTEAAGARLPLAIFEAPHSMVAEQFRHVRTRLQHAASLDTTRSMLVTGCSPDDGASTVATNLAAGLALNGRRILLVDANFRRPALHTIFGITNDVGFGDVLNDPDTFNEVLCETEVPNLTLITSGTRPSNPTELLESQLLIDFIERALEEYDHVIFDSGPLLMVSDSIALAPRVDGVITVVRARGNSRGILTRMRDEVRRLKAEHLGVVLNAVRVQNGGYYGPMIKNHYAYQAG